MRGLYEENGIIHYYGNLAGYVDDEAVVIDAIFDKKDLREFIARELGKTVEVREGIANELIEEGLKGRAAGSRSLGIQIFQLGKDSPLEERFISLSKRTERGFPNPCRKEYDLVYEGEVEEFDLEGIWERFARSVPRDFGGHALSISDVVCITDGEKERCFYLDQNGFTEIIF